MTFINDQAEEFGGGGGAFKIFLYRKENWLLYISLQPISKSSKKEMFH